MFQEAIFIPSSILEQTRRAKVARANLEHIYAFLSVRNKVIATEATGRDQNGGFLIENH